MPIYEDFVSIKNIAWIQIMCDNSLRTIKFDFKENEQNPVKSKYMTFKQFSKLADTYDEGSK